MSRRAYDAQKNLAESLISLGLYDQLLTLYETSLYNDVPYLYKVPSSVVLEHILTLSTLFSHCNEKEIHDMLYSSTKHSYPLVNTRAINVLNNLYAIVAGPTLDNSVEKGAQPNDSLSFGEKYTCGFVPEDVQLLKSRLIELVAFIKARDQETSKADLREKKILQNNHLSMIISGNTWQAFKWAIHSSQYAHAEKEKDLVRYQCWKGWFPVLNFLVNVMCLDLHERKLQPQTLGDSIIGQLLGQFKMRSFVAPAVHSIFVNRDIKGLPLNFQTSAAPVRSSIKPVFPNELKPSAERIIVENEDGDHNNDVIYLQKKCLVLVYIYLTRDERTQYADVLVSDSLNYLKTFSFRELMEFFFIQNASALISCGQSSSPELNPCLFDTCNGIDNVSNNDFTNLLLLRIAVEMLKELTGSEELLQVFGFVKDPKYATGSGFASLQVTLGSQSNLIMLLELEPLRLWRFASHTAEFAVDVIENNPELSLKELDDAIKQPGSYYDKLIKINLLTYFILQLWVSYTVSVSQNKEAVAALVRDRVSISAMVRKVEDNKIRNLRVIIKESLASKNVRNKERTEKNVDKIIVDLYLHIMTVHMDNLLYAF